MSNSSVVASPEAYTKALLHCYKHPSQPIMGFLIGKRLSDEGDSHANGNNNNNHHTQGGGASAAKGFYVMDAIPLFHSMLMTAPHPMLEVATAHTQSLAKTQGLSVLGLYVANELLLDAALSPLTTAVVDFVQRKLQQQQQPKLLLWFVHNEYLTSPPTSLAVSCMTADRCKAGQAVPPPGGEGGSLPLFFGQWNPNTLSTETNVQSESVIEMVANALDAFAQYRVTDFEDHLEDPAINYMEQPLAKLMKRA